MKSSVLVALSIIAVSIACTYKSAGSQPQARNSDAAQTQTPNNNTTQAQEKVPCKLTVAGAPDINGVRLGMATDEVLALFPGSKEDPEVHNNLLRPPSQFGQSSFIIRPDKFSSKENFPGINQITFTFLDGRVASLIFGYNGPEYSHVDKFAEKFVAGRNLPAVDQWDAYVGMDNTLKILKCTEFEVNVFIGGEGGKLNYVSVKDLVADKKLKDRRAKARAQQSPKPSP